MKRASTLVQWACPQVRDAARQVANEVVSGLEEMPLAPIHRDLKTEHIFVSGERVIFIDLDSVALGDPVRDPAHLWAHIAGRVGLQDLSPAEARTIGEAFAEEYFARVPASWRKQFALHCAGALIEVAGSIFKRQASGWRERVPALVELAQHTLSEGFM